MRFSPDLLATLRERVPLSEIVGRAVTWDRRKSQPGKGDYWACCPFHQEKSPSFHVDDRKGYFHCFGCHASGDHLSFLTEHDGLDFVDAVKALAERAGVTLEAAPRAEAAERRRRDAEGALEAAAALYAETLWSAAGRAARDYALGRGFTEETLRLFGFGLAPSAQGFLCRALAGQGFPPGDLEGVGLAVRRDGALSDRFRGRLMLPIHDGRGRIVGFGGRTVEGRDPKYLNSPETALFDKSRLLFNAHRARGPAHRTSRLVIVEGYLDAVALAQAGVGEAVASLGTSLTEDQIRLAWGLADEPVLCFDGDAAGRSAADRAIDRIVPLLSAGKSFGFLALPDGQDPDDLVRTGGRAAFEALAAAATPLVEAVFRREVDKGADTPERLAALETRLDAVAGTIQDMRVRKLYRSAFREQLFELRRFRSVHRAIPKRATLVSTSGPLTGSMVPSPPAGKGSLAHKEKLTLGLLIFQPQLIDVFSEEIAERLFIIDKHADFGQELLRVSSQIKSIDSRDLLAAVDRKYDDLVRDIWGDKGEEHGRKLLRRMPPLANGPDIGWTTRSLKALISDLQRQAIKAEAGEAATRFRDDETADEERLLNIMRQLDAEAESMTSSLADEAALLRRRKAAPATHSPAAKLS